MVIVHMSQQMAIVTHHTCTQHAPLTFLAHGQLLCKTQLATAYLASDLELFGFLQVITQEASGNAHPCTAGITGSHPSHFKHLLWHQGESYNMPCAPNTCATFTIITCSVNPGTKF